MKNLSTIFKLQLLVVIVLGITVSHSFAQNSNQNSRHISTKYEITFLIPEGSTKQPESTEENIIFLPDKSKFETGTGVNFAVIEEVNAAIISQSLARQESLETFAKGIIDGFQQADPGNKITLTEKKLVQIAGMNSVKVVAQASIANAPGVILRLVAITIPVPKHKRMYVFTITGIEKDFDKWLPIAEASANSFALIRAEPVKP